MMLEMDFAELYVTVINRMLTPNIIRIEFASNLFRNHIVQSNFVVQTNFLNEIRTSTKLSLSTASISAETNYATNCATNFAIYCAIQCVVCKTFVVCTSNRLDYLHCASV